MLVVQAMLFVWVASRTGPTRPRAAAGAVRGNRRARDRRGRRARPVARRRPLRARRVRTRRASGARGDGRWPRDDQRRQPAATGRAAPAGNPGALDARGLPARTRSIPGRTAVPAGGPAAGRLAGPGPRPERRAAPAGQMLLDRAGRAIRRSRSASWPGGPGGPGFVDPNLRGSGPGRSSSTGPVAGLVVVPPQPPFAFLLSRYAPTLALVAGGRAGRRRARWRRSSIFGPARRRLRAVEDAARRLGAGDLTARAPASGRRRSGRRRDRVQRDGRRPRGARRRAGRVGSRAAAAARRRLARADDAGDGDARLSRNAARCRSCQLDEAHARAVPRHHRRRNRAARAHHRRPARPGAARRRRRLARRRATCRWPQLFERVRARHERACADAGVDDDATRSSRAPKRCAAIAIGSSRRCRTWRPTRCGTRPRGTTIELGARPAARRRDARRHATTGPGIAAEHLPHVFDRFYKAEASRAPQATTPASGSGLGLSIVKAIVERHGGHISVDEPAGPDGVQLRRIAIPAAAARALRRELQPPLDLVERRQQLVNHPRHAVGARVDPAGFAHQLVPFDPRAEELSAPAPRARSPDTARCRCRGPVLTIALMISTFSVSMTMVGSIFSVTKNESITRRVADPASNSTNGWPARSAGTIAPLPRQRMRRHRHEQQLLAQHRHGHEIRLLDRQRQQSGVDAAGADLLDRSSGGRHGQPDVELRDARACRCLRSGGNTYRQTVMPPASRSVPRSVARAIGDRADRVAHVLEHALPELHEALGRRRHPHLAADAQEQRLAQLLFEQQQSAG